MPRRPFVTPPPRRVLGLDPSLTNTGVALLVDGRVVDHLVLTTPSSDPEPVRIHHLTLALRQIIDRYKPDHVAAEEFAVFYGRVNPASMFKMKAAQTIAMLAVMEAGVPLFLYSPQHWKPKGDPKKATVLYVQSRFGLATVNNDACDAIAIADYHLRLGRNLRHPVNVETEKPVPRRTRQEGEITILRRAAEVARGERLLPSESLALPGPTCADKMPDRGSVPT